MRSKKTLEMALLDIKEQIKNFIINQRFSKALDLLKYVSTSYQQPKRPYDRIKITPYTDAVSLSFSMEEYVNASFIETKQNLFIAAQNPKPEQEHVFIELLVKSEVTLIISLIPDPTYFKEHWLIYREVVKFQGADFLYDEKYMVGDREIRRIRCIDWVDFGVLDSSKMNFLMQFFNKIRTNIVVVHCEAGVGRTGVFIMYDMLKKEQDIDLDKFVDTLLYLRSKRSYLVTSAIQLEFLVQEFLEGKLEAKDLAPM